MTTFTDDILRETSCFHRHNKLNTVVYFCLLLEEVTQHLGWRLRHVRHYHGDKLTEDVVLTVVSKLITPVFVAKLVISGSQLLGSLHNWSVSDQKSRVPPRSVLILYYKHMYVRNVAQGRLLIVSVRQWHFMSINDQFMAYQGNGLCMKPLNKRWTMLVIKVSLVIVSRVSKPEKRVQCYASLRSTCLRHKWQAWRHVSDRTVDGRQETSCGVTSIAKWGDIPSTWCSYMSGVICTWSTHHFWLSCRFTVCPEVIHWIQEPVSVSFLSVRGPVRERGFNPKNDISKVI